MINLLEFLERFLSALLIVVLIFVTVFAPAALTYVFENLWFMCLYFVTIPLLAAIIAR